MRFGKLAAGTMAILAISWATASARAGHSGSAQSAHPNVIVILTDDQGTADLHIAGASDIDTPHLDGLARRGVRFSQFYAAAPVCSPSRAGLLTGRHPIRAGMPSNAPSEEGKPGMPGREVTIAEMLKARRIRHRPRRQVAPRLFARHHAAGPGLRQLVRPHGRLHRQLLAFLLLVRPQPPRPPPRRPRGPAARPLLRRPDGRGGPPPSCGSNKDRPFFLYFAINEPHYPYQGDPKWLEHYAGLKYPRNLYAAFLSTMDERIGRLIAELDALKPARADDRDRPVGSRPFDRGARPLRRRQRGHLPRGQVQPVRGGHPRAGDRELAGALARKARSATRSPTAATGCRRSPSSATSRCRRSTSTARASPR